MARAFGGSLPPIMWDGAGSDIRIADDVAALTLNLPDLNQPTSAASPAPVDLSGEANWPRVAAVVLPASMEAAAAAP
jgi:hypothetical protein